MLPRLTLAAWMLRARLNQQVTVRARLPWPERARLNQQVTVRTKVS